MLVAPVLALILGILGLVLGRYRAFAVAAIVISSFTLLMLFLRIMAAVCM